MASDASSSGLLTLANTIQTLTQRISLRLRESNLHEPHYDVSSPRELWESPTLGLKDTKAALVEAATSLQTLVMGPMAFHRGLFGMHYDLAALQVLLEFRVLEHIPTEGRGIELQKLAKEVQMDADKLGRTLRLMGTQRYVEEPEPGLFRHTVLSEVILRDDLLRAQGGMQLVDMHKASVEISDYLREKPHCSTSNESPFKFKWGRPLYEYYDAHPKEGARFAKAMQGIQRFDRPAVLLAQWIRETGLTHGKMIDVGGGNGHVCLNLAEQFKDWHFIVQDLHSVMFDQVTQKHAPEISSRINFEQHDFFTPQTVRSDIDAYVLRQCLHNWSDVDSILILRSFIPTLRANPHAALLINETIVPARGEIPLHEERQMRQIDVAMFVSSNAKQRTEVEWRSLVKDADPELRVARILRDQGTMTVLEVRFGGEVNGFK
ncbi:MAG: hypothetical protein M1828_002373 [Chrysothrix sp. TS-e1954]|nr:MAG: hypothetical protein M1828_002373 [Chrysothrix sp. TS-e1954]